MGEHAGIMSSIEALYGDFEHGVPRITGTLSGPDGLVIEVIEERMPAVFMSIDIHRPGIPGTVEADFGSGSGCRQMATDLATALADGTARITPRLALKVDDHDLASRVKRAMAEDMLAIRSKGTR